MELEFRFYFPPTVFGIYDTGNSVIYVFGNHTEHIEEVLSHETLHWVLQKLFGKEICLALDNIPKEELT